MRPAPPRGSRPPRRRGRRRGSRGETRRTILAAAGRLFSRHGYDGVSFRDIGRAAGVDPALIYHYFEGKESLFLETLHLSFEPLKARRSFSGGSREDLGERIILRFLDLWTSEGRGEPFLGILRACITNDRAAGIIRRFASERVLPSVRSDLDGDARLRTSLVGSQLFGIGVARHVLRLEPLPSMSNAEIARRLGPQVTMTLLGPTPAVNAFRPTSIRRKS